MARKKKAEKRIANVVSFAATAWRPIHRYRPASGMEAVSYSLFHFVIKQNAKGQWIARKGAAVEGYEPFLKFSRAEYFYAEQFADKAELQFIAVRLRHNKPVDDRLPIMLGLAEAGEMDWRPMDFMPEDFYL